MGGNRYWMWMGGRLLLAAGIVGWAASYLGPGSGEKEFQKTLVAMKQVHSFRAALTANPFGVQHNEMLWEVDCNRDIVYQHMHLVQAASSASTAQELTRDELHVGGLEYDRQSDGSWSNGKYINRDPAKAYCTHLAEGTDSNLLPQIATMIKRGVLVKGDKKRVNGVRCREWLVTMKGGPSGLEHDTVCLGLDDHLPYEMTTDWDHSLSTFSDYNSTIQFDGPEAIMQPASATTGSN